LTEGTYRTEASASSKLSGVYIGPLIRHCLRDKRGSRVQALRVPYNHGYSRAPPRDSLITSGHCYTSGGDCYTPGVTTLFSPLRSKSSSLCPNACSYSRAQRLPLKGSSKGQSYPECWLESVLRNYARSEAIAAGGQTDPARFSP
jgi:hypothetical protein